MILQLQLELKVEGTQVSLVKLCQWFEMPRLTVFYCPTNSAPKVHGKLVTLIEATIEENLSFGYRRVSHLLGMNKNTVQRVFQCVGWQVRKRPIGFRPRNQTLT
jgi:putative transposase